MNICDSIVTTTPTLCNYLQLISDKDVSVIPNFIGEEQAAISKQIRDLKNLPGNFNWEKITFGYFSGSPSHDKDFNLALPALQQLLFENSNLNLTVVGHLNLNTELLSEFKNQISIFPLQDFLSLQKLIAQVDFNIVPLQDNIFAQSKSALKYFDAGIVQTPTIASAIGELDRTMINRDVGILTTNLNWYDSLNSAITMKSEDVKTLGMNSLRDTENCHIGVTYREQIKAIYLDL
jgi:glycosyltransferase involved in cell wall biosynthesis